MRATKPQGPVLAALPAKPVIGILRKRTRRLTYDYQEQTF